MSDFIQLGKRSNETFSVSYRVDLFELRSTLSGEVMCTILRFSTEIISTIGGRKRPLVRAVSTSAKRSKDAQSGSKNSGYTHARNRLIVCDELEGLGKLGNRFQQTSEYLRKCLGTHVI